MEPRKRTRRIVRYVLLIIALIVVGVPTAVYVYDVTGERYRLATGDFPETLDQLVPDYLEELPPDPFDGEPL